MQEQEYKKHGKIYWHEAFFEALQLELYQYKDALMFESEHRLSQEALRMDVLVIKKDKDIQIDKNIGRIFKGHNIFEYKSESDTFSYWDYNKVLGYAHFYSSFMQIPLSDITVSIALTIYPHKLVKTLENERGYMIRNVSDGIYYIDGDVVAVQIIESKQLSPVDNLFLHNLRSNLSTDDILVTLQSYKAQKPLDDKAAYLDRLIKANSLVYKEAMEMGALKDIFLETAEEKGWLDDVRQQGIEQGITQGITQGLQRGKLESTIQFAKKMLIRGHPIEVISEDTGLSEETIIGLL